MILFRNTDNNRVMQIPDEEAFIYDRASNWVRVLAEVTNSREARILLTPPTVVIPKRKATK